MGKDYSEYVPSEQEQYRRRRRGNQFIELEYFINSVRFNAERKTLDIQVDGKKESLWMDELVEEYEVAREERFGEEFLGLEEASEEDWKENEEDVERLDKRYRVSYFPFEDILKSDQLYEKFGVEPRRVPMNNVLSGTNVNLNYGEGLLDFIYADFDTPAQAVIHYLDSWELHTDTPAEEKIYDQTQETVEKYYRYQNTLQFTKGIMMESLYTMVCPPVFTSGTVKLEAVRYYYEYLQTLQKEYLELVEFCFDESFHPDLLGERCPAERFHLYRQLRGLPISFERTESLSFSRVGVGETMPYGMPKEDLYQRLRERFPITDELNDFAERYHADPQKVSMLLTIPRYLRVGYEFSRVDQILELEFTKLLESDVRFRKCQRCGRYFILKGNFATRYCDRVEEWGKQSCQELAAKENFKRKAEDRPALAVYDLYYRRYAARKKVRQIKEADFKKWRYEAMRLRDDCEAGKLTVEEYRQWMEGYFPNRKKAGNQNSEQ